MALATTMTVTQSKSLCLKNNTVGLFSQILSYYAPKCFGKMYLRSRCTIMIPSRNYFCMRKFKKATHCLFDMDGTIIDSEMLYHKVVAKICDRYGKIYTRDLQDRCYGGTDRSVADTVIEELNLPMTAEDFERLLGDLVSRSLARTPEKPGAERLLSHLYEYNVPMALATNSSEQTLRIHAAAKPHLFGMFSHMVSVTDPQVDRGKPHPDLYLVAASRFADHPKAIECVVFEDSEIGVQAAVQAGMQVVMIPDYRLDRERTRQATLVIRSLRDFKPELFGLPPFNDASPNKPYQSRSKRAESKAIGRHSFAPSYFP